MEHATRKNQIDNFFINLKAKVTQEEQEVKDQELRQNLKNKVAKHVTEVRQTHQ